MKGLARVAPRLRLDSGLISRLTNKQNTIDGRCWWLYKAGYDPTPFVDFLEKIGGYSRGGKYHFGDPTFSQDFRLTKVFNLGEKAKISVLAEMFNAFNIATLTGYSFTLDTLAPGCSVTNGAFASCPSGATQPYNFGQPTQRAFQTFGSGGPRALQLGARFTF